MPVLLKSLSEASQSDEVIRLYLEVVAEICSVSDGTTDEQKALTDAIFTKFMLDLLAVFRLALSLVMPYDAYSTVPTASCFRTAGR